MKATLFQINEPNKATKMEIRDGRIIAKDDSVKGYTDMDELKKAL